MGSEMCIRDSFQAITCTGTDNSKQTRKYTKNTKRNPIYNKQRQENKTHTKLTVSKSTSEGSDWGLATTEGRFVKPERRWGRHRGTAGYKRKR